MVFCPNCNRSFDNDFEFCPYCGSKKPQAKVCPRCALETYEEFSFCPKCGAELMAGERYSEVIELIQGIVTNGDYENALAKCDELFDEKQYIGSRIKKAVIDVKEREIKLNDEIYEDLKEIREIEKRMTTNKIAMKKNNTLIEEINSKGAAYLSYDNMQQVRKLIGENEVLSEKNRVLGTRYDVLYAKIGDYSENTNQRRKLKL